MGILQTIGLMKCNLRMTFLSLVGGGFSPAERIYCIYNICVRIMHNNDVRNTFLCRVGNRF